MKKRIICLVLAAITAMGMLAACVPDDGGSTTPTIQNMNVGVSTLDTDTPPDLTGKTIKILTAESWLAGVTNADQPTFSRWKQVQERTGCTIIWETVASGEDYDTVLQTRLTGDPADCPDIVALKTASTGVMAKYIEDGLLYDITKAYDVCPNIEKFYNEYRPDLKAAFTYTDGGIYNLLANVFRTSEERNTLYGEVGENSLWYRGDIAAELGWTTYPKTIDELYKLLSDVKKAYPDMIPMHMWSMASWEGVYIFNASYGLHFNNEATGSYFYPDENGKVIFEPATDACKAWLTEMNKWFKEGLVYNIGSEDAKIGATATGTNFSGFYKNVHGLCEDLLQTVEPDAYFMYMPFPTKEGYETTISSRAQFSRAYLVIDNGDEDRCRAACQFMDYAWYSDYGIYCEIAGAEGEGWYLDKDGKFTINPYFAEAVVSGTLVQEMTGANTHFNGPSVSTYESKIAWENAKLAAQDKLGIERAMNAEQEKNWKEISAINSKFYCDNYPTYYMEKKDQAQLNAWANDLNTFVNEMLSKYMLGTADLSKFQTEFVDVLYNKMHLTEVLAMYQQYYDNYLANMNK